jgi:hypothetical protein
LRESIKKNLEKPYKYPGEEKRKKKRERGKNMEKYSVNIPYC